nr:MULTISPECIES: hypothetical protein [unclassified Duganella]
MDIINNPPKLGKHEALDEQFGRWWRFLNDLGVAVFLLFLSCLGAGENKHLCAVLSGALLGWRYAVGRVMFPSFITHLRNEGSTIRVVRLGKERAEDEGVRIGTVRRPPRGVPKVKFASENWYDVAWRELRLMTCCLAGDIFVS